MESTRLHRPCPRTGCRARTRLIPPLRSALEVWLQAAVEEHVQACPRPSRLSCLAALAREEGSPLLDRPARPPLDALPMSPKDQNWQALQRRAAVCLRGRRHEFSSHGLCIRPARACACRCPLPLWLDSLGMDSHAPSDVGIGSLPQLGCDLGRWLPGSDGKPGTRCPSARGTRSMHPCRMCR